MSITGVLVGTNLFRDLGQFLFIYFLITAYFASRRGVLGEVGRSILHFHLAIFNVLAVILALWVAWSFLDHLGSL